MKLRASVISIFTLIAFMASPALASDIQTVLAEGSSPVVKGRVKDARKRALADAKRNAVEQVGSRIVSSTVVENFELVRDRIATQAEGYVHGFRVLNENESSGEYIVEIEARVSKSSIAEDAARIYGKMHKPRVIVVIPEIRGGKTSLTSHAEDVVSEFFAQKKFNLVDRATAAEIIKADEMTKIALGDMAAAARLGKRAGAEVIITGTAEAGAVESVRGVLYSSRATVSMRALRTDNASVYAVTSQSRTSAGAMPDAAQRKAVESAAKSAASDVFWKIVKKWNEEKDKGADIEVVMSGVNFKSFRSIIKAVNSIDGVQSVIERSFDAPAAVLTVTYKGKAMDLAGMLSEAEFDGFKLEVLSVTPGKMDIKVK